MNLIKLFLLFPLSQIIWATPVFAEDASLQNGTEPSVIVEKKVDPEDTLLICAGFEAGRLENARLNGIRIYGSVENYYSLMHQMQCPPNQPSPIYAGVNLAATADGYFELFDDLAKLSLEARSRLLNRPTSGRRKNTILDLLDRRMKTATGQEELMDFYQERRRKFVELGAKKFSEMTPEELAVYE